MFRELKESDYRALAHIFGESYPQEPTQEQIEKEAAELIAEANIDTSKFIEDWMNVIKNASKGYRAVFRNGEYVIFTHEYTYETLEKMVIPDAKKARPDYEYIGIISEEEYQQKYAALGVKA